VIVAEEEKRLAFPKAANRSPEARPAGSEQNSTTSGEKASTQPEQFSSENPRDRRLNFFFFLNFLPLVTCLPPCLARPRRVPSWWIPFR
jgi:hypothetical protein